MSADQTGQGGGADRPGSVANQIAPSASAADAVAARVTVGAAATNTSDTARTAHVVDTAHTEDTAAPPAATQSSTAAQPPGALVGPATVARATEPIAAAQLMIIVDRARAHIVSLETARAQDRVRLGAALRELKASSAREEQLRAGVDALRRELGDALAQLQELRQAVLVPVLSPVAASTAAQIPVLSAMGDVRDLVKNLTQEQRDVTMQQREQTRINLLLMRSIQRFQEELSKEHRGNDMLRAKMMEALQASILGAATEGKPDDDSDSSSSSNSSGNSSHKDAKTAARPVHNNTNACRDAQQEDGTPRARGSSLDASTPGVVADISFNVSVTLDPKFGACAQFDPNWVVVDFRNMTPTVGKQQQQQQQQQGSCQGPLEASGVLLGDRLVCVNKRRTSDWSMDEVKEIFDAAKLGGGVLNMQFTRVPGTHQVAPAGWRGVPSIGSRRLRLACGHNTPGRRPPRPRRPSTSPAGDSSKLFIGTPTGRWR